MTFSETYHYRNDAKPERSRGSYPDAITDYHYKQLVDRYGIPMLKESPGQPAQFALIGLGKLGGAELGYHGDLDLILIYEGDGATAHSPKGGQHRKTLTNIELFTELVQRVIRTCGANGSRQTLFNRPSSSADGPIWYRCLSFFSLPELLSPGCRSLGKASLDSRPCHLRLAAVFSSRGRSHSRGNRRIRLA